MRSLRLKGDQGRGGAKNGLHWSNRILFGLGLNSFGLRGLGPGPENYA